MATGDLEMSEPRLCPQPVRLATVRLLRVCPQFRPFVLLGTQADSHSSIRDPGVNWLCQILPLEPATATCLSIAAFSPSRQI